VTIDGKYPLAEASKAHTALEERATRGKVILTPQRTVSLNYGHHFNSHEMMIIIHLMQ
jgi:hypothetical protein